MSATQDTTTTITTTTVAPSTIVESERPAVAKAGKAYKAGSDAFRTGIISLGASVGRLLSRLMNEAGQSSDEAESEASILVADVLGYSLDISTIRGYVKAAAVEATLKGTKAEGVLPVEALRAVASIPVSAEAADKAGVPTRQAFAESLIEAGTLSVRDVRDAVKQAKGTPDKASAGTAKRSTDVVKQYAKLAEASRVALIDAFGGRFDEDTNEALLECFVLACKIGRDGKAVPPFMRNALAELLYMGPENEHDPAESDDEAESK